MLWRKLGSCILTGLLIIGITGACLGENRPGSPPDPAKMEAELKKGLDSLVASNVITEEQEISIIKYFKDSAPEGGQPPQSMDKPSQERNDPLSRLVKDGVISQEQAQAIQKVMPKPPGPGPEGNGNEPPGGPPDAAGN